jgi:hypothetical protein
MWIVLVKQETRPEIKYGNLSGKVPSEDCGDGRTGRRSPVDGTVSGSLPDGVSISRISRSCASTILLYWMVVKRLQIWRGHRLCNLLHGEARVVNKFPDSYATRMFTAVIT